MPDQPAIEPFDATDAAADANAEREARRKERDDADALRKLMHSKQGRAFLYRRLERCHIYGNTFAPGQPDLTAFQLGQENIGKQLMMEAMAASADLYVQMVKEQRDEEARLDAVRRTEAARRDMRDGNAPAAQQLMPDLPPPAGYPGGPPLPKKKK